MLDCHTFGTNQAIWDVVLKDPILSNFQIPISTHLGARHFKHIFTNWALWAELV